MSDSKPGSQDVELILENARLRDALEPYLDDSLTLLNIRRFPTQEENEFLQSMLAWEQAPIVPISRWFEPELTLPPPEALSERQLHRTLWDTLRRLYEARVIIEFTEHLSDRQLYCIIYRDILPSPEKKLESRKSYLHWHCLDADQDAEIWLRYYASPQEREQWAVETGLEPPPSEPVPYPRRMPRWPM